MSRKTQNDYMKVVKKNEQSKISKIFNFPSRLNLLALGLIIIAYGFLIGFGIGCAIQDKDYIVIPEYEEMSYSENINMFYKIYSNYTVKTSYVGEDLDDLDPEEYLDKADTLTYQYYGVNNSKTQTLKANISAIYDDNSIKYFNTKKTNSTTGTKTGVQYLNSGTKQSKYPTEFFCDVDYTILDDTTNYNLKFSKKLLQLTKNDLKEDYKNDFTNASFKNEKDAVIKIFRSLAITVERPGATDSNPDSNKVKLSFTLTSESSSKYILDIQVFAVDTDGNILNLIGFYNLSNNTLLTYSNTSNLTKEIDIEDIYVKAQYKDSTGKVHDLLYKREFSNL